MIKRNKNSHRKQREMCGKKMKDLLCFTSAYTRCGLDAMQLLRRTVRKDLREEVDICFSNICEELQVIDGALHTQIFERRGFFSPSIATQDGQRIARALHNLCRRKKEESISCRDRSLCSALLCYTCSSKTQCFLADR